MSEKRRISATVDPEVKAYLQRDDVNCSGLINKLVKQHLSGGTTEEAMLRLRLEQVKSQRTELQERLDSKTTEEQTLEDRLEQLESSRESVLDDAEAVFNKDMLDVDNPAVEKWADDAEMTKDAFIDAMKTRLE